jgi:hypothetical protein
MDVSPLLRIHALRRMRECGEGQEARERPPAALVHPWTSKQEARLSPGFLVQA